jgi:hypothetical protein
MRIVWLSLVVVFTLKSHGALFPIIGFSNDTGTMLGLFWQNEISATSAIQTFGLTQKKGQSGFINASNLPFGNQTINIQFFGSNTGKSYYGIGNTSKKTDTETLYFSELSTTITVERPLVNQWNAVVGLTASYYNEDVGKNSGTREFPNITTLGLVLGAELDTRDKTINTQNGYYNAFTLNLYDGHSIFSNDVRYFKPMPHGVLATKVYSTQTLTHHPHILFLSGAGSYSYLRGYKTSDILDKHLSYAQLEWRAPVSAWFIAVPFIECGAIGAHPGQLKKSLVSYGFAGHIPFGGASLRLELAFAETNKEFYFGFNHVF